ncbi:MAG: hypothetical protein IPG50_14270 [Myxococcales bacterium]|nr:hypothetical protein [Myxococcales bacterium]
MSFAYRTFPAQPRGPLVAAALAVSALALVAASCAPEADIDERSVTLHVPLACPVPPNAYALLYPFGDFQQSAASPYQVFRESAARLDALPVNTRQLELDLAAGERRFRGLGLVPAAGPIDLLAWPEGSPCALTGTIGAPERTGHQLTVAGEFALVSGGTERERTPQSFLADLRTGALEALPVDGDLRTQRARAAAAAFPGGVLVTGGTRSDGSLLDSAERLTLADAAGRRFDAVIPLGQPRADHAAVALSTGEVLLVGGIGSRSLITSLELVDAKAGRARTAGLASLSSPRRFPRALRLANGEILVAGGFDENGVPVRKLEWFTRDATLAAHPPKEIDVGNEQGLVALPAGGALVVTTQAPPLSGASVVFISAEGETETAPSVLGNVTRVALFEAAAGAPILWTGDRWLRFRPWEGAFAPLALSATTGPVAGSVIATGDPSLLLWTDGPRLTGLRVDPLRGPYSSEVRPLLAGSDPSPMAPDRLVSPTTASSLRFDADRGLTVPQGARVVVADATYAAFEAEITITEGAMPHLVLRSEGGLEKELGGDPCPSPRPVGTTLVVARRGARVEQRAESGAAVTCEVPELARGRVVLGLKGTGEGATVRSFDIKRTP